jgi:hypothetical protein
MSSTESLATTTCVIRQFQLTATSWRRASILQGRRRRSRSRRRHLSAAAILSFGALINQLLHGDSIILEIKSYGAIMDRTLEVLVEFLSTKNVDYSEY